MNTENNSKLTINITPGSFLKGILVILFVWFLFFIKDIVLVVLTAVVIASGLEPLIHWFKKYKIRRLPAAIISYLGLFGIFAGLLFFFIPSVLDEASSFLTTLPKYLESVVLWNPLNVSQSDIITSQKVVQGISDGLIDSQQLVKGVVTNQIPSNSFGIGDLINGIKSITSNVSDGLVKIITTVFGGLLSFILIIVLSFYLLVQEDGVTKFLGLITPVKHEKYVVDIWKRSQIKIGQWMQGQLLLAVLVGVLVYLGLVVLGVKNALLLAVLAGILEIIPVFGPILSAIPAILASFIDGGLTMALLVLGLYVIVQQFENHLIYPLVVKKVVGISPIIVILALLIGAKLAGFLGVVLSVPVVSVVMEFIDDIEKSKNIFWKKVSESEKTNG
ncbi:MAG: AI-2E family transporter [Candidatus Paceibacterota bacterium]